MATKLLQVTFDLDVPAADYEAAVAPLATDFAAVSGLRWKIWIVNAETRQGGGILLFDDRAALGAFLDGPLAAGVRDHPAVRNFDARVFDVMAEPTAATRGPVEVEALRR